MEYDYSQLRGRIIGIYGTYKSFSDAIGLANTNVSLRLNGKTEFSHRDIDKWSRALNIEKKDIGFYFFNQKVKRN